MKIAFLLPTLDFGWDGIADYTSRLAEQCRAQGHETRLIALGRNNWLTRPLEMRRMLDKAKAEIVDFCPECLSWQFDGRIFHPLSIFPKWVIPDFSSFTKTIHLMAHETWEGDEPDARLRRRIKGMAQKLSFQGALRTLDPEIAHTTNPIYLDHLRSAKISASVLPLFSSVPVSQAVDARNDYDGGTWEFVLFGSFRDHWDPSEFISRLRESNRKIVVHHVGRHHSPEIMKSLRKACIGWAEFIEHGIQQDTSVSEILLNCHFAISTYTLQLLNKSSVFATFSDHGLPVIVPRQTHEMNNGASATVPQGVIFPDRHLSCLVGAQRLPVRDSLKITANHFLKALAKTSRTKLETV